MIYALKNGKTVHVRGPRIEDAAQIIHVIATADTETRFLARNPGELAVTVEQEQNMIARVLNDPDRTWFVVECDGQIVGQCAVGFVRGLARWRHRAEVAFVVLDRYCGMGIGGKMMQECLGWCRERGVMQVELEVVTDNQRALAMYRGFGFEVVGTQPRAMRYDDGTFADEYKMVKVL